MYLHAVRDFKCNKHQLILSQFTGGEAGGGVQQEGDGVRNILGGRDTLHRVQLLNTCMCNVWFVLSGVHVRQCVRDIVSDRGALHRVQLLCVCVQCLNFGSHLHQTSTKTAGTLV